MTHADDALLRRLIQQYAPPRPSSPRAQRIRLRPDLAGRHHDVCLSRFIAAHPLDSRRARLWATLLAKERAAAGPGALIVGTYNVRQLTPMAADATAADAARAVRWLFDTMSMDVLVLQEVKTAGSLGRLSPAVLVAHDPVSQIAVLVRDASRLVTAPVCRLYRHQGPGTTHRRGYCDFTYDGLRIAATHLEIGLRYTADGALLDPATMAARARTNTDTRTRQLRELIALGADVVAGDFNLEPWTPEFAVLAAAYDLPAIAAPTTPYNSRVDYIGYRKRPTAAAAAHCRRACVLDSPYSDHLPVVHVVATTTDPKNERRRFFSRHKTERYVRRDSRDGPPSSSHPLRRLCSGTGRAARAADVADRACPGGSV